MTNKELAQSIIELIGGSKNVTNLTHCVTRLRFNLKNYDLAYADAIKKIEGVVGCVHKGGQLQVIIGPHVQNIYDEAIQLVDTSSTSEDSGETKKGISSFFDTIAGIFTPIVGALAGSGMVKAILALSTTMGWLTTESQTYYLLNIMGDAVFYFLPFFIAVTASKKFKTSPFLALVFAGILLHPDLTALRTEGIEAVFLGVSVRLAVYSSSVIPIILIVLLQSYVEKFMRKITPNVVKVFLIPMVTILIVAPIGLIILAPLGAITGEYLGLFFTFLDARASWIVPLLVGSLAPLLVMTGMHYSLGAVQATQRAAVGYATVLAPGMLSSNMAQGGAVLAVAIRTKNKQLKSLATSTSISCFMGITEPALYGVTLQKKGALAATMIGGGTAGLYAGITAIKAYSAGTSNIFSVPIYMGGETMWSFYNALITVIIGAAAGFIASFLLYKEDEQSDVVNNTVEGTQTEQSSMTLSEEINQKVNVYSPLQGQLIPLTEVSDDAFSTQAMGKGIAVLPTKGQVVAPFDGEVSMIFKTNHAIGLKSEAGLELLIHIGIDTVKLEGEFFEAHIKEGDLIKKGDLLMSFDTEKISNAGYDLTTPIIVTNTKDYLDVIEGQVAIADKGTEILTAVK